MHPCFHSHFVLTETAQNVNCLINIGRLDGVLETGDGILIFESKIGKPETALAQIKEKKYYEPFLTGGKPVTLIGVGIDTDARNISGYPCEEWKSATGK